MSKTGYAILLVALFLSFGCDANQDALEDSLPEFYILTTQVSPEDGGSIQPESGEYLAGDSLEVEAIAADGYVFEQWEGDLSGNTNPNMIQLNSNSTVTAHFSLKDYHLNIDIEGSGTVREVVIERSAAVTVRLEAEAEEGWNFDRWEGDLSGSSNPETITLEDDEEKNVTAVFIEDAPDEYSLTIDTEGEGTVEKDPDQDSYTDGEEVTLTADAASGWSFVEWQGDLSGSDNPETITLDEDKEITAVFEQDDDAGEEYSLSINTEGEGSVEIDPDQDSYSEGDEVTLTAEAASGWSFKEWKGDISGSDNPEKITLDEDKEVIAVFEQDDAGEEYSLIINTDGDGTVDRDPDKDTYTDGEEVTLTANPASGWSFVEWEGGLSGSTNPQTITLDENKDVTAVFEQDESEEYSLSINTEGEGSVDRDPDKNSYTDGEEVTLTAEAASGWSFVEWQGDLSGSDNPETITLDEDKEVTAVFEQDPPDEYSLSIDTEGEGSVDRDPDKNSYTDGEEVTLTAEAASGWSFVEWQGDLSGSDNPETITLDEDKEVTAVFEQDPPDEYSLSIDTEGDGSVDRDPDQDSYTDGEEVTLTANPASGWSFVEWQGDLSGSTNPQTITLDEDKVVTAVFEEDPEEFSLSLSTEGDGSVDRDPDQDSYTDGEEVTLTANPASGWSFVEWQGDLSGSTNPQTITLDEDKEVTAVFEEDPEEYSLSISTEGEGSVDRNPDQDSYTDGEEVTLTANPASGWNFVEWRGDLSGSTNPQTITIDANMQVTAIFEVDSEASFSIQEVKLFIEAMALEGARQSSDFETNNFILNLPLDGTPFNITHVTLPEGYYSELELEIEQPDNSVNIRDSDFRDGSRSYSLVVNGLFNDADFTYQSEEDFEIEVDIAPHLEIESGQTSVIAIDVDFEDWFRGDDDELLDPNDSGNADKINNNIEDSFSDFEDNYKPGR